MHPLQIKLAAARRRVRRLLIVYGTSRALAVVLPVLVVLGGDRLSASLRRPRCADDLVARRRGACWSGRSHVIWRRRYDNGSTIWSSPNGLNHISPASGSSFPARSSFSARMRTTRWPAAPRFAERPSRRPRPASVRWIGRWPSIAGPLSGGGSGRRHRARRGRDLHVPPVRRVLGRRAACQSAG